MRQLFHEPQKVFPGYPHRQCNQPIAVCRELGDALRELNDLEVHSHLRQR